jgi:hypothetical protein
MRSIAVLFFICFVVSRVSFAEEMVRFCMRNLEKSENYFEVNHMSYFKINKTMIDKFPQSALAQIATKRMPTEIHLVKEENYYSERNQLEAKGVPCYYLYSYFDPKVFQEILRWMATGDTEMKRKHTHA